MCSAQCAVTVCWLCVCPALPSLSKNSRQRKDREPRRGRFQAANLDLSPGICPLPACLQVIAVICVLVWIMNINRFNDPALGGWVSGEAARGEEQGQCRAAGGSWAGRLQEKGGGRVGGCAS